MLSMSSLLFILLFPLSSFHRLRSLLSQTYSLATGVDWRVRWPSLDASVGTNITGSESSVGHHFTANDEEAIRDFFFNAREHS